MRLYVGGGERGTDKEGPGRKLPKVTTLAHSCIETTAVSCLLPPEPRPSFWSLFSKPILPFDKGQRDAKKWMEVQKVWKVQPRDLYMTDHKRVYYCCEYIDRDRPLTWLSAIIRLALFKNHRTHGRKLPAS